MSLGLYYRLSLADGDVGTDDKEESNSIENQRLLLTSFVASRDDLVGEIKEYIDDGFSGTSFDRPEFKLMIEDAKKGVIHTIIVKDLSRLGRDYIGVGDYLEQIFPVQIYPSTLYILNRILNYSRFLFLMNYNTRYC